MHCKSCSSYQLTFDRENAEKEQSDYEAQGLKKMTRPMVEILQQQDLYGLTLLDIGGGIGAIGFELLNSGVQKTVNVDISQAYLEVFQQLADQKGFIDKAVAMPGDFIDLAKEVEPSDIVTLDKVICCYPNYKSLIKLSLDKCHRYYAYVIPRDVWWVHAGEWLESWIRRLKGKPFKTYIHPVADIERLVTSAGFNKIGQQFQREWLISIFEKQSPVNH